MNLRTKSLILISAYDSKQIIKTIINIMHNSPNYAQNMHELVERGIDPDRYW